jgi:hypothetical protein
MSDWLVLAAMLPGAPSSPRVPIRQALEASGWAGLREGVYRRPASAPAASDLWAIARAFDTAGGDAHVAEIQARDAAPEEALRARFDCRAQCADFARALPEARGSHTLYAALRQQLE